MQVSDEAVASALESTTGHPTLVLLRANTRTWVIPLFIEHLEQVEWAPAEWLYEKVQEVLDRVPDQDSSEDLLPLGKTAANYCRDWVDSRWLDTDVVDGNLRYSLSEHSMRALQFVRSLIEGETTISGARLKSIAFAVRQLADMTNPDKDLQRERIRKQIDELTEQLKALDGGARQATAEEMQQQLQEVVTMTRSLPADFRRLRTMVEDRHQYVARRAMAEDLPKGDLVDVYLREHDLLAETSEGRAYRGFTELLVSGGASQLIADVEMVLGQPATQEKTTPEQRDSLNTMLSTLLDADHNVYASYVRWSGSLRRFLTRAVGAEEQRIATLADRALAAGAEWARRGTGRRRVPAEILGIGTLNVQDISQTELWQERADHEIVIEIADNRGALPQTDRAALRLTAGTSIRAMSRIINRLLAEDSVVNAADVFDATPEEFRRLGAVVSLLDIAIAHGQVNTEMTETVELRGDGTTPVITTLPHLVFDTPIPVKEKK